MNFKNIDLTTISQSNITILYPFIYDKTKVKKLNTHNIVKLKNEALKDFLPYTKNFFGKYHFEDKEPSNISFPMIYKDTKTSHIDFPKDNKIDKSVDISNISIYFFDMSIGILTITYQMPKNMTDEQFLYYHQKLSTIEKRSKQNISTSNGEDFKYYYEFIDSLLVSYTVNSTNIFSRSNLYTYNLLVATSTNEDKKTQNFIEPLLQYRSSVNNTNTNELATNHIHQVSNIYTLANENVVLHIGIKHNNSDNDNFIDNEFFIKYQQNHLLTYIITLFQSTKIEQLIIKAFFQNDKTKDLKNIRDIKAEILHFISNGDFTKISNNSIRNNLYKFYRRNFEIKDMLSEIQTIADKLSNELETIVQDKKAQSDERRNLYIGIIGVVLAIIQIYQAL